MDASQLLGNEQREGAPDLHIESIEELGQPKESVVMFGVWPAGHALMIYLLSNEHIVGSKFAT